MEAQKKSAKGWSSWLCQTKGNKELGEVAGECAGWVRGYPLFQVHLDRWREDVVAIESQSRGQWSGHRQLWPAWPMVS